MSSRQLQVQRSRYARPRGPLGPACGPFGPAAGPSGPQGGPFGPALLYVYSQVGCARATWPWARPLPAALNNGSVEGRRMPKPWARAPQEHQAQFPKISSDFVAWLERIVAKKAFECIGQINFSVYICRKTSQKHCLQDSKTCSPFARPL